MDLTDKLVIVTGGAKGIGLAIAEQLASRRAKVAIIDTDESALAEISSDSRYVCRSCDLTNEGQINTLLPELFSTFGPVWGLVNNAGLMHSEPLFSPMGAHKRHLIENWRRVIDINLTAPFVISSYVVENMVMNRTKGLIINISSVSARGNPGQTAYAAAKSGLEAMTKVWSRELGSVGVRSIAIAPGFVDTPSMHGAIRKHQLDEIKMKVPLKRVGRVDEIASAVIFAFENDYLNGVVIPVDGGIVL